MEVQATGRKVGWLACWQAALHCNPVVRTLGLCVRESRMVLCSLCYPGKSRLRLIAACETRVSYDEVFLMLVLCLGLLEILPILG